MTVIKVGLSADVHFNLPKRSEEAKRILWWMLEDWKARGVHLIGFAGDLADGPMTERDRAWLIEYIAACAEVAPTVVIEGNHDTALSLRNAVGRLKGKYPVIVEDKADVHVVETDAGPVAVPCVSFPSKAALLAAVGRPVSGEEADQIAGQALQDVFRGLGVKVQELGLPSIALVHGTISGSKIAEDQPDRPMGLSMPPAELALMGADLTVCGHVHLQQHFSFNSKDFVVPGSPFFADFGESAYKKGYILAEFEQTAAYEGASVEDAELVPRVSTRWQRVPTPAIPMLLLEANYTTEGEFVWLANGAFPMSWEIEGSFDVGQIVKGADVRLRFNFASDQRKAAVEAATGIAGLLRVEGAVNVTLDPIQTPTTRSRIPALATTVRLEDKWKLYCTAIGLELSREREAVLLEMLHELQEAAAAQGVAIGAVGRDAPTLKKFRGKSMFKFPNGFELDFETMAGPLTAIVAPNEAGKSVLMQLMGQGLIYGNTPTRGTLDDLAVDNGAFIEGEFSMGGVDYKLTQVASTKSASGRTSYPGTVSLLKNGKAELGNKSAGGRDDYDKWAARNMLPRSMYDSVICQSGTTNVIDMKDGPRVELLLKVLGLEIYEALAKLARDRAAAVSGELSGVRARIEEIGEANTEHLLEVVGEYRQALDAETGNVNIFARDLRDAQVRSTAIDKQRAEYNALVVRRDELAGQVTALRERRTQLDTRIQVSKALTDQKETIEQAVVDVGLLEVEIAGKPTHDLELTLAKAVADEERLENERLALIRRADELITQEQDLSGRLVDSDTKTVAARSVVADAGTIRKAVTESKEYTVKWDAKREEINGQRVREAELEGVLRDVRARFNGNAQKASELARKRNELSIAVEGKAGVRQSVAAVANRSKDIETVTVAIGHYRAEIEHLQSLMTSAASTETAALRDGHKDIIAGSDAIPRAERALEDADHAIAEADDGPQSLVEAKEQLAKCEEALKQYQRSLAGAQADAARLPHIEACEKTLAETLAEIETVDALHQSLTEESNSIVAQQSELAVAREQSESDLRWLQEQITGLEPVVGRAELLATADTKLQALEEQAATIKADREAVRESLAGIQLAAKSLTTQAAALATESWKREIENNQVAITDLKAKIEALKPAADKATLLAIAESAAEQLLHQISGLNAELEALEHKHDQVERQIDEATIPDVVDLAPFEAAVSAARLALTDIQARLAVAEKELKDAEAKEGRQQELAGRVRGLEDKQANYTLLGQHLGKQGLQSEEISVAGPQLTDITNDLLRSAGDTRHTLSIETERLHSNKKDMIPCLDLNIFDSEEGITKESRRLSDAGKILVGWPFRLALIILGCERTGVHGPTIMVDESTGPCDEVNATRVIAMLRRFAERLQSRVIFIAQQRAINELADSRILLQAGKVVIE